MAKKAPKPTVATAPPAAPTQPQPRTLASMSREELEAEILQREMNVLATRHNELNARLNQLKQVITNQSQNVTQNVT